MISLINSSQNSQQTIGNTHSGFHILASIITEWFDNTLKDRSNYYLREETTQNKVENLLASFQRVNQSKRQAKKI